MDYCGTLLHNFCSGSCEVLRRQVPVAGGRVRAVVDFNTWELSRRAGHSRSGWQSTLSQIAPSIFGYLHVNLLTVKQSTNVSTHTIEQCMFPCCILFQSDSQVLLELGHLTDFSFSFNFVILNPKVLFPMGREGSVGIEEHQQPQPEWWSLTEQC